MLLRLAWRNVGRNKRRTGLTLAAAVFAVVMVMNGIALTTGLHAKMIEDSVRVHSGHLQVTGAGYLADRTLERYLRWRPALARAIDGTPGVRGAAPRVNGFALLSNDATSQGVALIGVDPERERRVSSLPAQVRRGAFLPRGVSRPIVLGESLAERLRVGVGDAVVVSSVAYTLENAYDLFTVSGLVRLSDRRVERSLALISLADAQDLLAYGDRVSEVALLADDPDRLPELARAVARRLAPVSAEPIEVNPWQRVMPDLAQIILLDDVQNSLTFAILVIVVAFGLLNTLLMSVLERQRELGVMLALGASPRALFGLVYLESLLLSIVGLAIGLAIALPMVAYLQQHPIPLTGTAQQATELFGFEPVICWKLTPVNPLFSAGLMLAIALLAAFQPAWRASRARPADALRSL